MYVVVVVASPGNSKFAVINFGSVPPTVVMMDGPGSGNVVDCYGTVAAVAANSGKLIWLFDISAPASPVQIGTLQAPFLIGSISIYGSYVLVGELFGSRVALADFSNPAIPFGITDCQMANLDNIISVALRSPTPTVEPPLTAVVSGLENDTVFVYYEDLSEGAPIGVAVSIRQNAWPSDFDGWTAAMMSGGSIYTYPVSGNSVSHPTTIASGEPLGSVAVAEIPAGGQFVAASGTGSFTVFANPTGFPIGSIKKSLPSYIGSPGIAVKFLNNPAIPPYLAVANVTQSDVSVSYYSIELETGRPQGSVVSLIEPSNSVVPVTLLPSLVPTLGITALTPPHAPQHGGAVVEGSVPVKE